MMKQRAQRWLKQSQQAVPACPMSATYGYHKDACGGRRGEAATLALFLCSGAAAFITGMDFPIDGGALKLCI